MVVKTMASQAAAATSPAGTDALTRLTPFGWLGGLVAILVALAVSFFALSYALVYWRNADQDLVIVYNALLLNDGKPQIYFDHPAYLSILVTSAWFRLLHAVGYLHAYALSAVPPASQADAFAAALTEAIRAARLLALVLGLATVVGFAALIRRMVDDWRVALLATFALAMSGGMVMHLGRLRSELLAAVLALGALMILIPAARRATRGRPVLLGVAALLCVLALTNKAHAILLIAAFPVLLLPFGSAESASVKPWRDFRSALLPLSVLAATACAALLAATPLIVEGLDPQVAAEGSIANFLGLPLGLLSAIIALWLAAGVVAFAIVWRVSAAETLATFLAIIAGAALGLLALAIVHQPLNSVAVMNPLERMLGWAVPGTANSNAGLFALLPYDFAVMLARLTFVLAPSSRPAVFLVWLIVPGIVYAWLRGERQLALQTIALVAVAFGIDTLGMRRGLKAEYWIFTDPLIIIAGALLLDRFKGWHGHRLALPVALALMIVHVGVGQSGAVRTALLRAGPGPICEWNRYYLPLMPVPFCPP